MLESLFGLIGLAPAARRSAADTGARDTRSQPVAFDAGKFQRRLRGLPTSTTAINAQIRRYGKTVVARSRYLAANNPYAAAAKEAFVSALVGSGIKPSSLIQDAAQKAALQQLFLDWTDEADADWLTDFYGLQAIIAGEMFEAGECFIRIRMRLPEDGLTVPMQLQVLPSEMLPTEHNEDLGVRGRIECGIQFDPIGRRTAYHFLRQHPANDQLFGNSVLKTIVPAEEVLHLYRPAAAGQIRGIPHTLSAIVTAAILDCYDDAELERKRVAALFGAFVKRPAIDDDEHPLEGGAPVPPMASGPEPAGDWGLEPGAAIDLEPGEDIAFANPADVGGNYEAFQYRSLLRMAAGFGVPYAAMTGDLRQTSYGSIRAGLVEFRRRVEQMQNAVMVFQFCRPVWQRWLQEAVLSRAAPFTPSQFLANSRDLTRVKWITPKWEWIDPLKDLQAEKLAVDNGFKSRSDVIEASGYDPEETDQRIAADDKRAESLGLEFDKVKQPAAPVDQTPPTSPQDNITPTNRALEVLAEAMKLQADKPPVNIHLPDVHVAVPEIKIPDIVAEVHIPRQKPPIVNVAAPVVNVHVPKRKITNVEHDARGRIVKTISEEE